MADPLPPMIPLIGVPCAWCGQPGLVTILDPAGRRTKHNDRRLPDCPTTRKATR